MAWLKDPEGEGHPKIGLTYRLLRKLNRSLMSTWFRELDLVDNENMPHEGGIMFVAWHPSGLIDLYPENYQFWQNILCSNCQS
ncbi:MAG: hypothetical protein ACPGIG_01345 [Candidatus Poseidoniaceae archaeon]